MPLKPRQALFVKEYLVSKNATEAAIKAGYSKKTANKSGPALLVNMGIREAIDAGLKKEQSKLEDKIAALGITKERWLERLAEIGFAKYDNYVTVTKQSMSVIDTEERLKAHPGSGGAIRKITQSFSQHGGSISLELHPPQPALETLGKTFGWVKDQLELTGKDGKPIQTQRVMNAEEREEERVRIKRVLELAKKKK